MTNQNFRRRSTRRLMASPNCRTNYPCTNFRSTTDSNMRNFRTICWAMGCCCGKNLMTMIRCWNARTNRNCHCGTSCCPSLFRTVCYCWRFPILTACMMGCCSIPACRSVCKFPTNSAVRHGTTRSALRAPYCLMTSAVTSCCGKSRYCLPASCRKMCLMLRCGMSSVPTMRI